MTKRINIFETDPKAYEAMVALEKYLAASQLNSSHKHLIKIRASQINGCAFCINMHTVDARKDGETEQRIYLLNAWRETSLFTEEEKVILAMTEEITYIHKGGVSDETYDKAQKLFSAEYIAVIVMAATTINAWNRISVSLRKEIQ